MSILRNRPNPTRPVKIRRWVNVNQLEQGMYVCELDLPWSETRFMFQGFRIESPATLRELQRVCTQVLVETEKVAQLSTRSAGRLCTTRWPFGINH